MFNKYVCVKQHDITDCGAAGLATLARHYGLRITISKIRDIAGTDRRGTNLLGLVEAAEQLGFVAKAVRGKWESLPHIPLPAVAYVSIKQLLHYVVIHQVKDLEALRAKKTSLLAQVEIEKEKAELELKISQTAAQTREDVVSSRRAAVRVALAELKDSEQRLKSSEKMAEHNMVARIKLEEAKTVAEVARAKVEQAEAQERQAKRDMHSAQMSLELTKKKVNILLEESTRRLTDIENQIASEKM